MQTYIFTPTVAGQGPTIKIYGGLVVTNQVMPNGTVGEPYSHQFQVGGTYEGPVTFSRPPLRQDGVTTNPDWPAGLGMDANGFVSGVPTEPGTSDLPDVVVESAQ